MVHLEKAFEIVIDLAKGNALDIDECADDATLREEAERQNEAIALIERVLHYFQNIDK